MGHFHTIGGLAQAQRRIAKEADGHRGRGAVLGHAQGVAHGVGGVEGEEHHVAVEALDMADGACGADDAYHGRGCQHAQLGAALLAHLVESTVGTGAGDEEGHAVAVGVVGYVRRLDETLGADIGGGAVADIVQQQASIVDALAQGVVKVGVVGAYRARFLMVGIGIEAVDIDLRHGGFEGLGNSLGGVGEGGVTRASGVGVVGQQGHIVAPVAAVRLVFEVDAGEVAFHFVHQQGGLAFVLGRQAADAHLESLR